MKASSAKRRVSPYAQVSPPPFSAPRSRTTQQRSLVVTSSDRGGPSSSNSGLGHSPAAAAAYLEKRRHMLWQPPSPYLEDLTKSLVVSQPARKKLQLVPPRRYPTAVSPYETLREASRIGRAQLRAQLQAEMAERQLQRLWDMEAAAAAERCGVDMLTYTTLLELQHRDITPEDYDMLQQLDNSTKRQTIEQSDLDERFPAWRIGGEDAAEDGGEWARTLTCKHTFHAECIDAWLTTSSHKCPQDGLPVFPELAGDDDDDEDGGMGAQYADEDDDDAALMMRGGMPVPEADDDDGEGEW